jgi:hypothetical protein
MIQLADAAECENRLVLGLYQKVNDPFDSQRSVMPLFSDEVPFQPHFVSLLGSQGNV